MAYWWDVHQNKRKKSYLYRAIDAEDHTLYIWLSKQRNHHSAYAFIKRFFKQFGKLQIVITDKAPSTKVVMAKVIKRFKLHSNRHCSSKSKITGILKWERQDQSINTAKNTLKGIECIYGLVYI